MDKSIRQPNIVFVVTDDQGYGDLGCTGNPILKTPHIDTFYNDSIHLQNFHVGPTCAPTRAGILTGHYANSTGVWHTIGGRSLLRKDEVTIADALKSAGYRTGLFGKWHLGDNYPYRPQDRGFDEVVTHGGGGISQTPDYWGNDYFDDTYWVNGEPKQFEGYCTDVWFREAMQFIEANQEQPFFCYIAPNAPHSPYNVEAEYSAPYHGQMSKDRANFFGMIANIDENFGKLRAWLGELGLEDNTILIFMTDNGTAAGITVDENEYAVDGFNAGMRGTKGSKYEGGHRVPFFVRWADGGLDEQRDISQLTANIDLMPTLLDLCGVDISQYSFHGQSIRPLLDDADTEWAERTLVTDSQRLTNPIKWRKSAVMDEKWRLIDGKELYDIRQDLEQRHDLAEQYPDVVQALRAEYEVWWEIVSEQFEQDIPITIGQALHEEVRLTCHDWRNDSAFTPWHQGLIRQGYQEDGYWEVTAEQAGQYTLRLYRWAPETTYKLTDGIDGDDISWRKDVITDNYADWYTGGVALSLERAEVVIDFPNGGEQIRQSADIPDDTACATFEVTLPQGSLHLNGNFALQDGSQLGAYYLTVEYQG